MTTLDSRYLGLTDCYAHHFSAAGTFRYGVSPLPASLTAADREEDELTVVVRPAGQAGQQQHVVVVGRRDGGLSAEPKRLEISVGDFVTWSANGTVPTGFAVRGTLGETVIDSAALDDESVFTHAFGLPGEFYWRDANGSDLGGVVRVVHPDQQDARHKEWTAALESGTVVHINGERAEPREVEVLAGQTVVWIVQEAPGITITDASLLRDR